jgi:cytochrome P450
MTHFCPAYPKPQKRRLSPFFRLFNSRSSWLDVQYERSYRMQMGEIHLPKLDVYMINQPDLVNKVMVENASDYPKSELLGDALRPLLGDSIFTTNGAQWRRQRTMMEPAFAQARTAIAFPVMRDCVEAMLKRLEKIPNNTEHDVEVEMTHVTADIIFRTIFSVPLEGEAAKQIFTAFAVYQKLAPQLLWPSLIGLKWLVLPWQARKSRKAASFIRSQLETLIKPRFEAHRNGLPSKEQDILESFLDARDPNTNDAFTFKELVDQVAMLFLAGHETSASALTWALYLIAESPDVQERMHTEVLTLDTKKLLSTSDMKGLELTWNVFRETLRLFPPVGYIVRQATQTCPMRDKTVKKGATVMVSPWLIHRHRDLWEQPDAFNPDRYNNEQSRESLKNAYLPFSMGPRVCIGAAFALQEAVLVLSSISRHYHLKPVPGHVPQPVGRLTIRSANGVRLILSRRAELSSNAAA